MNRYSNLLIRTSAIFALIGAFLGSHMAGSGNYIFRPVHAHVLVVGWLSLFSWGMYYKVFKPKDGLLAKLHVYSALIGTVGLTVGMTLYSFRPEFLSTAIINVFYIVGGSILLVSFLLFVLMTFLNSGEEKN